MPSNVFLFYFFSHQGPCSANSCCAHFFFFLDQTHCFFFSKTTLVIISNWNGSIYCWISGMKVAVFHSFRWWSNLAPCTSLVEAFCCFVCILFCGLCRCNCTSIAYVLLMKYVPQMVSYIDFTLKARMNRRDPSWCISVNIWVNYIQECPC